MSITSEEAHKVIEGGVAKAQELGNRVTITVVDSAGEITAVHRMDGAGGFNFDLSYGLAYTSAMFKRRGDQLAGLQQQPWFPGLREMRGGRLLVAKGALPIKRGDDAVGAVGVSGAPEDADLAIAEAGLAALA